MSKKHMAVVDFMDEGFLQEANRLFFHPRGLALSVVIESGGSARLSGIRDCREDPEGIVFAKGLLSTDKALAVEDERLRHVSAREKLLGDSIQALP